MNSFKTVKDAKKPKKRAYSKYKCDICSKQFSEKAGLTNHQATHSEETPFWCDQCPYKGKTSKYLRRHVKIAHEARKFECETCGKKFHFGCKLKDHMRVHTGEKPYKCGVCEQAFNSSYSLKTHQLIHTDSKPYKCSFCAYACRDSSTLRKHQLRHQGIVTRYLCNLCDVSCTTKALLQIHVSEIHLNLDTRRHPCESCGKRFRQRHQLVNHIQAVHEKTKRVKCEVCGVVLSNRSNLPYHMRTHAAGRPYVCSVDGCPKRYKDTSSLQKHIITHYPSKQYSCDICGRRFTREKRMRAHLRVHEVKVKNVQCDHCGVSFYNKTYLATHIHRKHGTKRQTYICDVCGLSTTNKPSIVMHVKYGHAVANRRPLKCTICKKLFKHKFNLKLHYWVAHELDEIPKRHRRPNKPKKLSIDIKQEPVNLYDDDEYLEISPKLEPLDDDGIELTNIAPTNAHSPAEGPAIAPSIESPQTQASPELAVEDKMKPRIVREQCEGRRPGPRLKHPVDIEAEEKVREQVNRLMEETRRKTASRALERTRRKYNRLMKKAVKNCNRKVAKKYISTKIAVKKDLSKDQAKNSEGVINNTTEEIVEKPNKEEEINHVGKEIGNENEGEKVNVEVKLDNIQENLDLEETKNRQRRSGTRQRKGTVKYTETDEHENAADKGDAINERDKTEMGGRNRKLKLNTHQCYVCFKLFQTKEELLEHCKDHFALCNVKTLKKCPLCDFATNLSVTTHLRRKHNIKLKALYGTFKDNKQTEGSRYYYEVNDELIKKVEIIPSIKNLNKLASNKIDKINREKKNKGVVKNKLVKKGKEWIVMKEKVKITDCLLPKFDNVESRNVNGGYIDRLKELYKLAKKEGKTMLFPCDSCDKVCQTLSALKLHGRKHESNPKPFKPKVWKHKCKNTNDQPKIVKEVTNKDNRTAQPKPVVNKHKCERELIDFYERNIKGSDVEFWQFLKIYNKMGRENINDFDDLQKSNSFGLHCNVLPEENTSNGNNNEDIDTNTNNINPNNENIRNVAMRKTATVKIKKNIRNAFTRVVRLSNRELIRRNEAKIKLREKIKQNCQNM